MGLPLFDLACMLIAYIIGWFIYSAVTLIFSIEGIQRLPMIQQLQECLSSNSYSFTDYLTKLQAFLLNILNMLLTYSGNIIGFITTLLVTPDASSETISPYVDSGQSGDGPFIRTHNQQNSNKDSIRETLPDRLLASPRRSDPKLVPTIETRSSNPNLLASSASPRTTTPKQRKLLLKWYGDNFSSSRMENLDDINYSDNSPKYVRSIQTTSMLQIPNASSPNQSSSDILH